MWEMRRSCSAIAGAWHARLGRRGRQVHHSLENWGLVAAPPTSSLLSLSILCQNTRASIVAEVSDMNECLSLRTRSNEIEELPVFLSLDEAVRYGTDWKGRIRTELKNETDVCWSFGNVGNCLLVCLLDIPEWPRNAADQEMQRTHEQRATSSVLSMTGIRYARLSWVEAGQGRRANKWEPQVDVMGTSNQTLW